MTDRQKAIVLAMAEHNMNKVEAGKSLFYSRSNVLYHCGEIYKQTGLDPRKFYDLVKLVEMVKEGVHLCVPDVKVITVHLPNGRPEVIPYGEREVNEV